MGFLQHITGYFRRSKKVATPGELRRGAVPFWLYQADGLGLQVATVYRCVKFLSESVANLPVRYLRLKDGIFVDATDHRLDYLLNIQPDRAHNAFDFWRQVVINLLLDGNAYIVPFYIPGTFELDRLALCDRHTVTHDTLNDTYKISDATNGVYGTYAENEVIHFKGMPGQDSKRGVSVLNYARLTLAIAQSGDTETHNRFANGGSVRGLITNDKSVQGFGEYADDELESLASKIGSFFDGGGNITSIPGKADFTQISLSSVDMQFLESRKFTVLEICRFFGVHPSFVFSDTSSNYKSAEQANVAFLSHTLNPLLRSIEIELRRKLLAPSRACKFKFEFDRRGLHACDLDGMMNYRIKLLQTGTTVNEVRRLDNLPPVEAGDAVLVSANLKSITEIGQPAAAAEPVEDNNDNNDESDQKNEEE